MAEFDPKLLVVGLEHAIMQHLREDADDGFHTYEVGEYYPHAIGYCPLRYYYIYKYAKESTLPDRAINITSAGRIAHDLVQSSLRRLGYELEKPFSIDLDDGIRIVGRVDAYWPGGAFTSRSSDPLAEAVSSLFREKEIPPHVVEIKSVRRYFPREPYDKHKEQLNIYLNALNVDFGIFIYVSRDDFTRRLFYFQRDPALYLKSLEWVRTLHTALLSDTPPAPAPVADWECDGCPLNGVCPASTAQRRIHDFVG
jgi:CRISPR/Cas system-associated exonuclease Cas4 (RecB family)